MVPGAGCVGESSGDDAKTVAVEHYPDELHNECKHHLPRVVGAHVSIPDRGESGRGPVETEYVVVDSSRGTIQYPVIVSPAGP